MSLIRTETRDTKRAADHCTTCVASRFLSGAKMKSGVLI